MITFGDRETAIAMATRCFIPPLSSCGYIRATPGSSPTPERRPAVRSAISDPLILLMWSLKPFAIWFPTFITGFNEFIAPCGT